MPGAVDILVNNAGTQHVAPVDEFPPEKWDLILALNLSAAFHTIRLALPAMKAKGWGRIINTASAHSLVASPNKSAYVAAKHGIAGLTKTVALEAAPFGVTVNCISPGYVWTPLVENQIPDTMAARGLTREQVMNDVLLAAQPTKKFVTVDQVAALALFLCRDEAARSPAPISAWTAAGRRREACGGSTAGASSADEASPRCPPACLAIARRRAEHRRGSARRRLAGLATEDDRRRHPQLARCLDEALRDVADGENAGEIARGGRLVRAGHRAARSGAAAGRSIIAGRSSSAPSRDMLDYIAYPDFRCRIAQARRTAGVHQADRLAAARRPALSGQQPADGFPRHLDARRRDPHASATASTASATWSECSSGSGRTAGGSLFPIRITNPCST